MKRWLFLSYGVAGHLTFLVVYLWLAGFVGNLFVPSSIDLPVRDSTGSAAAIDLALIGVFVLQHSIMARPGFKRAWTRLIPQPIERATYVWASNAVTALLIWQWRPIGGIVWDFQSPVLRGLLWGLFACGWLAVPVVSMFINHFDLFGTRQVWMYWRGQKYSHLPFRTPFLYAHVRHPLYLGWMLAFWATPTITVGHLLFSGSLTIYMVSAAVLEERDLAGHFGRQYRHYQQSVGMFVPKFLLFAGLKSVSEPQSGEILAAPAESGVSARGD